MDLIRAARHFLGETDDPHEVSAGPDGVTIKFYNDETPTQYSLTLPEAQAQLPKATAVEARGPSISAAPHEDVRQKLRGEYLPPPPSEPHIRARTTLEAVTDAARDVGHAVGQFPLIQLTNKLGLTSFGDERPYVDPTAKYDVMMGDPGMPAKGMAGTLGEAATSGAAKLRERFAETLKHYLTPGEAPFYSRLDEAAQTLPKQTFAPKIAGLVQKGQAAQEELVARNVPEFLAQAGNKPITKAALQEHLAANPAPQLKVKTLAVTTADELAKAVQRDFGVEPPATPQAWTSLAERFERGAQQWQRNGDRVQANRLFRLSEQATEMAEGLDLGRGLSAGQPKFAQYQLPGGTNYRETLITLPDAGEAGFQKLVAARDAVNAKIQAAASSSRNPRFATPPPELVERYNAFQAQIDAMQSQQFRSAHFDEPNILVHTRSNTRELPGLGSGTFLEEVQSDWHQKGKAQGYQDPQALAVIAQREQAAQAELVALQPKLHAAYQADSPAYDALAKRRDVLTREHAQARIERRAIEEGVPHAPFKETWPDLALKHHLAEASVDPNVNWLGFTSGETQAARYDLSKQISHIDYRKTPQGYELGAVDIHGDGVPLPKQIYQPQELPDVVGKEIADKIVSGQGQPGGGRMTLRGLDLKVGGEGMHAFYDNLLPKRLEKIVKPFGGTVERIPSIGSGPPSPAEMAEWTRQWNAAPTASGWRVTDADGTVLGRVLRGTPAGGGASTAAEAIAHVLQQTTVADKRSLLTAPAWIVKLTPEMKAKILKSGMALMTGLGAVGALEAQRPGQATPGGKQ